MWIKKISLWRVWGVCSSPDGKSKIVTSVKKVFQIGEKKLKKEQHGQKSLVSPNQADLMRRQKS